MKITRTKILMVTAVILTLAMAVAGCAPVTEDPEPLGGSKVVLGLEDPVDFRSEDLYYGHVEPEMIEDLTVVLERFPAADVPYPGGLLNEHQTWDGEDGLRVDYGADMFDYMDMFREDEDNPNDFGVHIATDAESDEEVAEWYRDELEAHGWTITEYDVKEVEAETHIKAEKDGDQLEVLIYMGGDGPGYERDEAIEERWDYAVFALLMDLA